MTQLRHNERTKGLYPMKRRTFLFQSGAGFAATALRGFGQTAGAPGLGAEVIRAPGGHAVDQPIAHPGILQTRYDLAFMKAKINAGEEPWKSAWNLWLSGTESSLDFEPKPFVHVVRGA